MSAISIDNELVHYEVLGRGRPVILLHSWVGSWRYWVPTMQNLQLKYRVYAVDLHGFGDTSKSGRKYSLDNQVDLLSAFMKAMAIPKAAIVGHGLGAWVTIKFARLYPDQAPRIVLVSPPFFDMPGLNKRVRPGRMAAAPHEKAISAEASIEATIMNSTMRAAMLERLRASKGSDSSDDGLIPAELLQNAAQAAPRYNPLFSILGRSSPEDVLQRCVKRSSPFYEKLAVDLPKTDPEAIRASASEYDCGRVLDDAWLLPMLTLVIHGQDDDLIEPPSEAVWDYITYQKEDTLLPIPLPGVGHFPMLEYERFNRLVTDFLEAADLSTLEIKEQWKRRSR